MFEWQQQHGGEIPQNQNNLPCGGANIIAIAKKAPKINEALTEAYRILIHTSGIEMPQYTDHVPVLDRNTQLRVGYLLGDITEARFKQRLRINEKAADKNRNIREVLHMYIESATELFRRMEQHKTQQKIQKEFRELNKIREYANKSLAKICRQYTMTNVLQINEKGNPVKVKRVDLE